MSERYIRSPANPAIRELRRLIQKSRLRRERGIAVIEGLREAERAAAAGATIHQIVWNPELLARQRHQELPAVLAGVPDRIVVPPELLGKLGRRATPAPLIAVADAPGQDLAVFEPPQPALILVAEQLEKPGNVGAIARTAAATDAALIAVDPLLDPGNPNLIRASQGAVYEIPFAVADRDRLFAWLARRRIPLIAAAPDAGTSYWDAPLTGPVALLVGNEAHGASPAARRAANAAVRIPMRARHTDSLNAATAAALLLYEALRQRTVASGG